MTLLRINNRILKKNGTLLTGGESPAPVLPPYTIRLKFTEGVMPTFSKGTGVQVSSSPNIWDLTYENSDWYYVLADQSDLLEVVKFNTVGITNMNSMLTNSYYLQSVCLFDTSNVTDMSWMFGGCQSLTSIPLLDTSKVTVMSRMFYGCISLVSVPLFDTSSVTNMGSMFYNCYNVQSGALALYQQASSQATPPSNHTDTFYDCGRDTTTGAAELAQIPQDWGGNALPDDVPIV